MKHFIKLIIFSLTIVFAHAVPFSCSTDAYIFSSTAFNTQTDTYSFDLMSGNELSRKANIHPSNINAIGYNVIDNHIWGYDRANYKVVKVDANYQVTSYDIGNLPSFAPADENYPTYHAGDVSLDGILHLFTISDTKTIYRVDVNPLSVNYLKTLPPITLSSAIAFSDFAFSPLNNLLYAIDLDENLIRIDQNTGTVTNLGKTNMPSSGNVASVFFDKDGNFYAHHSNNANVYKITIPTTVQQRGIKATFLSNIGTTSHGDGARCAYASIKLGKNISGYVFNDINSNQIKESSETGLNASSYVKLCQTDNSYVKSLLADPTTGSYTISDVQSGDYFLLEDSSNSTDCTTMDDIENWESTTPNKLSINIKSKDIDDQNFGNVLINKSKISATVSDLQQVEGNSGLSDFKIMITLDEPAPKGGLIFAYQTIDETAINSDYQTSNSSTPNVNTSGLTGYDPNNPDHVNYQRYWDNWLIFAISYGKYTAFYTNKYSSYEAYYINELGMTPKDISSGSQKQTTPLKTISKSTNSVEDYIKQEGNLTINAGETSGSIVVGVLGDTVIENDETFMLKLFPPSTVEMLKDEGNITILNDDDNLSHQPIAEYRFDECEWNGTAGEVKDSSKNGLNATAKNGATLTTGVINTAGKFDGNAYIDIPQNSKLSLTKDISMSFWVNPTEQAYSVANSQQNFIVKGFGTEFRVDFWYDGIEKCLCVAYTHGNNSQMVDPDNDKIYWDNWYHFTLVRDVTTKMVHFYIDGTLIDSKPYDTLGIGEPTSQLSGVTLSSGTSASKFKGEIDEVKFFNGLLSNTEISTMYSNEKNGLNWDGTTRPPVECSQSLQPFTCDETLYLSNRNILGTGNVDGNSTWLHSVDTNATPYNYQVIGEKYSSNSNGYNALGYNIEDNFMYALDGNTLLKIDKNATIKNLGVVSGLPIEQLYAGEFDRDGFFYAFGNDVASGQIYKIDINTMSVVDTLTIQEGSKPKAVRFWDMAIDETGGYFYVMLITDGDGDSKFNNDKFAKINIKTGELTTIGSDKSTMSSYISLIFSDKDGDVFIMSNENGFYQINTTSGEIFERSLTQDLTLYNDGTSCPDANRSEPPRMSINDVEQAEGDSGLTEFKFTVVLDKPALANTNFWFTLTDGVDAINPIEMAIQLPGNDDDYKGNSAYVTIPQGSRQFDIVAYVVGDTKMEHHEEFYVDLYAPTNLIIQDSHGVGTIINDDTVLFNVERTNSHTVDNATQTQKESLYTQITGRDFNYALIAYDENQSKNSEVNLQDVTLKVDLINKDSSSNTKLLYTNYLYFPSNSVQSRMSVTDINDLNLSIATREAEYQISYLVDGNGSIVYGQYDNTIDYNALQTQSNEKSNGSRDSFAIRPASYRMTIKGITNNSGGYDANNTVVLQARVGYMGGKNSSIEHIVSNDTTLNKMPLTAEHAYELSMYATRYASETIAFDYTLLSSAELNANLILNNKTLLTCDDESNHARAYLFTNGSSQDNLLSHNNVGNYALNLQDSNWTTIDQESNSTLAGCLPNVGTISASGDEKSGCNIESNLSNAQSNYFPRHYNIDIDFEAYAFDLKNFSLSNQPNTGKNYIYMDDLLNNSTGMGIKLEGNVTAVGENGTILSNFTQSCVAKDVELLIEQNITTDKGSFFNTNVAFETTKGTPLQPTMITQHNGVTTASEYKSLNAPIGVEKAYFLDSNKGSSELSILYNIQKNLNEATNPIKIDLFSIDANATTALSSLNDKEWSASGTKELNTTKYFYFARLQPDMENYNHTFDALLSTPVTVEIFCEHHRLWCTEEMLQDNERNNNNSQMGWYTAKNHNTLLEGGILGFTVDNPKIDVTPVSSLSYKEGRYTNITTTNTLPMMQAQEHAHIDITTNSWLNYHPVTFGGIPFWNITFEERKESVPSGIGQMGHRLEVERTISPVNRVDW